MTTEANKALIRDYYAHVINEHNGSALSTFLQPDAVEHNEGTRHEIGLTAVQQTFATRWNAFPDLKTAIDDLIAENDKVVVRVTWTGTHQGNVHDLTPSGRAVRFSGVEIYRIVNDKIAEIWHHADVAGVTQQISLSSSVPQ